MRLRASRSPFILATTAATISRTPSARASTRWAALSLSTVLALGCTAPEGGAAPKSGDAKGPAASNAKAGEKQATPTEGDAADAAAAKVAAEEVIGSTDPTAVPLPEPPLTDEEKRILEADPETLTAEERKQLPFLRRRKIMQNPESPAAKSLQRAAAAYAAGELPAPPPLPAAEGDAAPK